MKTNKIEPFFKNKNIAICMSSSNEYSIFLGVVIESIIENSSKNYNYDIIVMNTNISSKNKEIIVSLTKKYSNICVRFLEINDFVSQYKFYTWANFTRFTYYRLIIPKVFKYYDKILYVDSDIIVNSDIANLYNTNINGYLLGACRDTHVVARLNKAIKNNNYNDVKYYHEVLHILNNRSYAQCGILLFNIKEIRSIFHEDFLIEEASMRKYRWLDQDIINVNFKGMIKFLPNVWNVMTFNNPIIDEIDLPEDLKIEYYNARKNPKIVHYIGRSFPSYEPYGDFNTLYWKYARNTPYYEYLLSQMIDIKIAKNRRKK